MKFYRRPTFSGVSRGLRRFIIGLAMKVLMGSTLGMLIEVLAASDEQSLLALGLMAFAFILKLYYDFAGYGDMALGLASALGFKLPGNLSSSLASKSILRLGKLCFITAAAWIRKIPLWANLTAIAASIALFHEAAWGGIQKILQFGSAVFTLQSFSGVFSLYYLHSYAFVLAAAAIGATGIPAKFLKRICRTRAVRRLSSVPLAVCLFVSTAFITDTISLHEASWISKQLHTVRAFTTFYVFRNLDSGGLFYDSRYGISRFEQRSEAQIAGQISESGRRLGTMFELFPDDAKVYLTVIPEKSHYTAHSRVAGNPHRAAELVQAQLPPYVTTIDITPALTADDFYRTDLHWCQTRLSREGGVIETLAAAMSFEPPPITNISELGGFFGVYYRQFALPLRPDVMQIRHAPNVRGFYLDERQSALEMRPILIEGEVYSEQMLNSSDPYSVFLRGPQPILWLENTDNNTGRTLYLFRDSFASSIAPLLALSASYDTVVLIDLRYIDGRILDSFVEFESGADVLLLYSTQLLGNATMFRGRG
ncbi:MAG: hypothetical protein FWD35_02710 [Oscillospiraceae bacterium]|nr:hypothetical protein [Oscillospiraceae bacterium]